MTDLGVVPSSGIVVISPLSTCPDPDAVEIKHNLNSSSMKLKRLFVYCGSTNQVTYFAPIPSGRISIASFSVGVCGDFTVFVDSLFCPSESVLEKERPGESLECR